MRTSKSSVAVAFFLPGRAKDLSASPVLVFQTDRERVQYYKLRNKIP